MQKKIRLIDIAKKAKVSIGTVDRVLHKRGEVNEETRKKIMSIVDDLGYTPNILAKSLASKQTKKLAVIIPDSSDDNPYWDKPIAGINRAVSEISSFNTEVIYETYDATDEQSFAKVSENMLKSSFDGVIFNPVFQASSLNFIKNLGERKIPYIFIDINLKDVDNLAYFGQDAEQSGQVAAKLMQFGLPENATILIVKLANKKSFSRHIVKREMGFINYLKNNSILKKINTFSVEIDLLEPNEPHSTLERVFCETHKINGIFVPNSRVFKVADYLIKTNSTDILLSGYDLIDKNVKYLKNGAIDFLISQKPEEQAYKSIMTLFNYIMSKKECAKTNYSSIDIILKENIDFYKNF